MKARNEKERLVNLRQYVKASSRSSTLKTIALLASKICKSSYAIISFVDERKVIIQSKVGFNVSGMPHEHSFCAEGIKKKNLFMVKDAAKDRRFSSLPIVLRGPRIRFYAGVPIISPEGYTLGMLAVLDKHVLTLTTEQRNALVYLCRLAVSYLSCNKNSVLKKGTAKNADKSTGETRNKVLSSIQHEIRTPLNGIIGTADLLGKTVLTAEQKEYIDTIRLSGESLLTVINSHEGLSDTSEKTNQAISPNVNRDAETPPPLPREFSPRPSSNGNPGNLEKVPSMNILVAEDNIVNQKLLVRILKTLGLTADVVANGKEALDAFEQKEYDLILMDIQMPEMDGIEATRRIRNVADRHQPIILAVTAQQGDKEKCLEAGMNDYMSKPIRLEDVRRMLLKWYDIIHKS